MAIWHSMTDQWFRDSISSIGVSKGCGGGRGKGGVLTERV